MPMDRSSLTECWVGLVFHLPGGSDVGHQGQVDEERPLAPEIERHLANRFEEGQRLDVADGAADLHHGDVRARRARLDARLDLVRDVRNHLHGAAEILSAPLAAYHALVDLAGREVVPPAHGERTKRS